MTNLRTRGVGSATLRCEGSCFTRVPTREVQLRTNLVRAELRAVFYLTCFCFRFLITQLWESRQWTKILTFLRLEVKLISSSSTLQNNPQWLPQLFFLSSRKSDGVGYKITKKKAALRSFYVCPSRFAKTLLKRKKKLICILLATAATKHKRHKRALL